MAHRNFQIDPAGSIVRKVLMLLLPLVWAGQLMGVTPTVETAPELEFRKIYPADSLTTAPIMALYQDRKGFLWIGSSEGLLRYDGYSFSHYVNVPDDSGSLSDNRIWSIMEDARGILWIGTEEGGLNAFDPARDSFTRYLPDPVDTNGLGLGYVLAAHEDQRGYLWVGLAQGGLCRLDRRTGKFKHYKDNPYDPMSFSGTVVSNFLEDQDQQFWITSRGGGVNLYDPETDTFVDLRPTSEENYYPRGVTGIVEADSNAYWVSTMGGGIYMMTSVVTQGQRQLRFTHLDMETRIVEAGNIFRLVQDPFGQLWCATWGAGLLRVDPETGTLTQYTQGSGDPDPASLFVHNVMIDRSGVLWAGSDEGLFMATLNRLRLPLDARDSVQALTDTLNPMIDSRELGDDESPPQIELTNFLLFGRPVDIKDKNAPLQTNIAYARKLILNHEQNEFTLEFSVLDYVEPSLQRYAYRLEGLNQDWTFIENQREVTFSGLDPGRYVFMVKGSNAEGNWSQEPRTLKVIIRPPWWRSWWALTLYLLVIVSVIRFIRQRALTL